MERLNLTILGLIFLTFDQLARKARTVLVKPWKPCHYILLDIIRPLCTRAGAERSPSLVFPWSHLCTVCMLLWLYSKPSTLDKDNTVVCSYYNSRCVDVVVVMVVVDHAAEGLAETLRRLYTYVALINSGPCSG